MHLRCVPHSKAKYDNFPLHCHTQSLLQCLEVGVILSMDKRFCFECESEKLIYLEKMRSEGSIRFLFWTYFLLICVHSSVGKYKTNLITRV